MSATSEPVRRGMAIRLLVCAPILILILSRCGSGGERPPGAPVTAPPGPELVIEAGKAVSIRADARGAERYEWELEGAGSISAREGEAVLFTPPDSEGTARLGVVASNKHGNSPKTSLTISIIAKASVGLAALGVPGGWMSGVAPPEQFIDVGYECEGGRNCVRLTYRPGGKWGGVIWWPLKCGATGTPAAWELVKSGNCGVNVPQTGNLKEVRRLTFQARGERGGEVIEFKVGDNNFPPRPVKSTGLLTLTRDWKQYEIDMKGVELSNAVGLFSWSATDARNPQGTTFYLDDIKFEGVR